MQLEDDRPALAVGRNAIYLGRNAIWRMPKRPVAALEHFVDSPAPIRQIALQGDKVFWLTTSEDPGSALLMAEEELGLVRKLDLGAGVEAALTGARGVALLASDQLIVAGFRVDSELQRIVRLAPGTVALFFDIQARGPLELAVDDERVYARVDFAISAWDDSGLLYEAPSEAENLVADEASLYWRINDATPRFVRASKRTLRAIELGAAPGGELVLAPDESSGYLYWTDDTGSLFRMPTAGGSAELFASTGNFDDDDYSPVLALDETSVYWLGGAPGTRARDGDPVWLYRICK